MFIGYMKPLQLCTVNAQVICSNRSIDSTSKEKDENLVDVFELLEELMLRWEWHFDAWTEEKRADEV
ncbi:hypothetical protein BCON_0093g00280 [Botryotinia convoluta]|uniref:Uncharacterized protein n=1 Tax=Botryotinia convoluta TaxID=54673 RepID=A0A4Z1I241_9HELO|nr:hypothetical protein BCON_0093g00280 [Botryotinia convoluta]